MLPDIEKLLDLQIADQEIRKLQEEIAELPRRIAAIELKLAGTRAHLEKARAAAKADEANKKKFESSIQDLQGKISKYRDQSLDVKTNDQYKALLHEIQFSEQEIRINEDRIRFRPESHFRSSPGRGRRLDQDVENVVVDQDWRHTVGTAAAAARQVE